MTSNLINHKDYTKFKDFYQLVLPLNLEGLIPEDDSVRLLSHVLEGLDYTELYAAYSSKGRKPALEPKTMFKILVYAYSQNIYSSRAIEKSCRRDINFRWILAGAKAPDHSTIDRFRHIYALSAIEGLFYQLVNFLHAAGELQFKNVFIDGTKIEANANRYSFVRHRPTVLQKQHDQVKEYLERQQGYDSSKDKFDGRNSYSKTDTDATFMHMKEDHMMNGQLKPGYNLQIGVEAEYVTGVGIFSDRNDLNTLKPMLENMKEKCGHKYQNIIADSGYESEEGYVYLETNHQTAYIKPQTYEKWKKKSFKNDISKRENMQYDVEKDEYTCHCGKKLRFRYIGHSRSASGYISEVSHYECECCSGCPCKEKCTKSTGNRKLYVSKNFVKMRQHSYENIISEEGILLRVNRSIQVEGAFGVLKDDYKFKRFLTRGTNNIKTEFLFLVIGYDINKLHSKTQGNRLKQELHSLKKTA